MTAKLKLLSLVVLLVLFSCHTKPATSPASQKSASALFTELLSEQTTNDALDPLRNLAKSDASARQLLVEKLPPLIEAGPFAKTSRHIEEVWINEVNLAGDLNIVEAAPALAKWIKVSDGGGGMRSLSDAETLRGKPAAQSLVQMSDAALPALQKVLTTGDANEKRIAARTLIFIGTPKAKKVAQQDHPSRYHMTQDELCCMTTNAVSPVYPSEARLAGTQGEVKVLIVLDAAKKLKELQTLSGNPVLVDAVQKAIRQWEFLPTGYGAEGPKETEIPVTFTFKLETPKPAYIKLKNGKVIKADVVHEFADQIDYIENGTTHRVSPQSVTTISACYGDLMLHKPHEGDCIPSGAPHFDVRAIPIETP